MSVCSLIDAVIETLETVDTNGDEGGSSGASGGASGGGNRPHFCFVDIISSTQHRSTPEGIEAFRDDLGGLENVITTAARTVVFCTPLLRPAALTRCWCIYEIMKSMIHGKHVHVGLTSSDRNDLDNVLISNFDEIMTMFGTLYANNAMATEPKDRDFVFEGAEATTGFQRRSA